jgi:methyl-accepting chemotaxis protein
MSGAKSWFASAPMRYKILLGYGVILVFMLLITVVVLVQTANIDSLRSESERSELLRLEGEQIGLAIADRTAAYRDFLLTGQDSALVAYEEAQERLRTALARGSELVRDSAQTERLQSVADLSRTWELEVAQLGIPLRQATRQPGGPPLDSAIAFAQSGTGRRAASQARTALRQFQQRQADVTDERNGALRRTVERIRWVTLLATFFAALFGFLVAALIASRISAPLTRAVGLAGAVASGDLTQQLPVEGDDEVGKLVATLNRMAADLRDTIGRVNTATVQVASAAEQIAATSEKISTTVDDQVRATEETSSSMEQIAAQITRVARSAESLAVSVEQTSSSIGEMSQSIEQTATNTDALGASVEQSSATIEEMVASITQVGRHVQETREIARGAQSDAGAGSEAVMHTTRAMRRIHKETTALVETIRGLGSSSEAIGRISEVIEDIADQTNLLALNAAIEAARAGEHGRGFAVVAQEIRRLAERSVESTREITATIRGVVTEVGRAVQSTDAVAERTSEGIGLADAAAEALQKILDSSARTRDLMEEVSLATQHQIGAAEQAQEAMRHIQQIAEEARLTTREQAYGSRQILHATENMNQQTQEVFAATAEQKRGGELILQSTESVNQGARATQQAVAEVVTAASDLSNQAAGLTALVQEFRV